jgi:hypothetical protein
MRLDASCRSSRDRVGRLGRKVGEASLEAGNARPANERVVERLVGAIDGGDIPPAHTISDYIDYAANHTPLIHARTATRRREKGFNALMLSLARIDQTSAGPPAALESPCRIRWTLSMQRSAFRTNQTRNGIVFNLGEFALTACQPRSQ